MLQCRQFSEKLKSFSDENFTDVKEKEFAVYVGGPIPLRARSDGELTKTSCNFHDAMENGSSRNLDEYILLDNREPSSNYPRHCHPVFSELEDYSWVLLPSSDVGSVDRKLLSDAKTVNGKLESKTNEDKVTESSSSLPDKLRKLRSDIENSVIRKLPMTSQMDKPNRPHNELEFFDDHYKQNETQRLLQFEPKSINEVEKLPENKEAKPIPRPNIGLFDRNIVTSREKVTNNNISLLGRPNSVNETYHQDPSTLIDTCPDVNRYIPSSPFSCTTAQTVVKPLALYPSPSIAQTKADDSKSNNHDPAGLGLEILPPQSIKYDDVDLIQLSSSSSLAYESYTPPAENEGDQMKGLDSKLPTDSEFVCEWPFLNPIKKTITDENNLRFGRDKFEPVKSQQNKNARLERRQNLPPSDGDRGIHLLKLSEKGVDEPQLLSFSGYLEGTCRDLEAARHSTAVEYEYKTNLVKDLGSDNNKANSIHQMKEMSTEKKSEDQESCEVRTPPLNSACMDKDLINFFTQDALSSSPSTLSRETSEEADREVADIMGQESDDYFIEFKSESSSNDWSVSSADSDVVDLNLLKLKQCKGMLIHDQLAVVPSTSPESLPRDQTPEECKVEGTYHDRGMDELLEQSNYLSVKNDSQLCNKSRKILTNFVSGDKSMLECLSEDEKKTVSENTRDNDSTGYLENYEKPIDQPQSQNVIENIHTVSSNQVYDSTQQKPIPSEEEKTEQGLIQRYRPVEKVSSESLLQRLPNVPDFLPSDVKVETDGEINPDITPPMVLLDIRNSLNEPTVLDRSYPSPDIFAKARMRPADGLHRTEMNCILSELSREHAECERLSRDSRRARGEFLETKWAVDQLLAKLNRPLEPQ